MFFNGESEESMWWSSLFPTPPLQHQWHMLMLLLHNAKLRKMQCSRGHLDLCLWIHVSCMYIKSILVLVRNSQHHFLTGLGV